MRSFQYPQLATPVLAPIFPVPALAWQGSFPSEARAATMHPATSGAVTNELAPASPIPSPIVWEPRYPSLAPGLEPLSPAAEPFFGTGAVKPVFPLPSPTAWSAIYPDRIDVKLPLPLGESVLNTLIIQSPMVVYSHSGGIIGGGRQLQFQRTARAPLIILTESTPLDRWIPRYADIARGDAPLVDRSPGWFGVMTRSALALPAPLVWQSKYPDRIDRLSQAPETNQAPRSLQPLVVAAAPVLSWAPRYSDIVRSVAQPLREMFQYHFAAITGIPLMWGPRYPDEARGAIVSIAALAQATPSVPSVSTLPLPGRLAWKAVYPDTALRTRAPVEAFPTGSLYPFPIQTTIPTLAWSSQFADAVNRLTLPVGTMQSWATGVVPSTLPPPSPTSWMSVWPDSALAGSFATAEQPAWTGPTLVLITPVPLRSWAPDYQDQTWPAQGLLTAEQMAWKGDVKGPGIIVPPLSWESTCPDEAPAQYRLPLGALQSSALSVNSAIPVPARAWDGVYPTAVDRRIMPAADAWTFSWVSIQLAHLPHRRIMLLAARAVYTLLASRSTTITLQASDEDEE